jgi:hypothetical protein
MKPGGVPVPPPVNFKGLIRPHWASHLKFQKDSAKIAKNEKRLAFF